MTLVFRKANLTIVINVNLTLLNGRNVGLHAFGHIRSTRSPVRSYVDIEAGSRVGH